jgi:hypothetical protein
VCEGVRCTSVQSPRAVAARPAQQNAGQQRLAGGFQHPGRDQAQQGRLAHCNRKGRLSAEPLVIGPEPGAECQHEVIDQAQSFELAVPGLEFQAVVPKPGRQLHNRLNPQLKHLQGAHGVAIAARTQGLELVRIQQGVDHALLLAQIIRQALPVPVHCQGQLLAGTEGQGHGQLAGAA